MGKTIKVWMDMMNLQILKGKEIEKNLACKELLVNWQINTILPKELIWQINTVSTKKLNAESEYFSPELQIMCVKFTSINSTFVISSPNPMFDHL